MCVLVVGFDSKAHQAAHTRLRRKLRRCGVQSPLLKPALPLPQMSPCQRRPIPATRVKTIIADSDWMRSQTHQEDQFGEKNSRGFQPNGESRNNWELHFGNAAKCLPRGTSFVNAIYYYRKSSITASFHGDQAGHEIVAQA